MVGDYTKLGNGKVKWVMCAAKEVMLQSYLEGTCSPCNHEHW